MERLCASGLKIVISNSSEQELLGALLDLANITDKITGADDAESSKRDPDLIGAALARADLDPAAAVMVGDTRYDITAASRAGVKTIALRSGGWSDHDLAAAIAIYDGPADLLNYYDEPLLAQGGK